MPQEAVIPPQKTQCVNFRWRVRQRKNHSLTDSAILDFGKEITCRAPEFLWEAEFATAYRGQGTSRQTAILSGSQRAVTQLMVLESDRQTLAPQAFIKSSLMLDTAAVGLHEAGV
ncbi:hypothetical protein JZ751_027879, partial [Albula glossodonta]